MLSLSPRCLPLRMGSAMSVRLLVGLVAVSVVLAAGGASADPQYEWLRLDRHHVKWGVPQAGAGTVVTYAVVADPMHSPNARNCRDMLSFDGLTARSRIAAATLEAELEAAFAMWQAAADIRFRRADVPAAADILIGAQATPQGVAFADVAYDRSAGEGMRRIRRSLVCLNPERTWTAGFDGDPGTYDLRYALAHEIGHAIGLDHPGPTGQLMSFRYDEQFRALQPGDIAGIVGLYGPGGGTLAGAATSEPNEVGPATHGAPATGGCGTGERAPAATTALTPRDDGC